VDLCIDHANLDEIMTVVEGHAEWESRSLSPPVDGAGLKADAGGTSQSGGGSVAMPSIGAGERKPMTRIVRRCVDVVVSGVVLLLTLPILLLAALALKLASPGDPVIVRDIRLGSRGKPFEMLRLRTEDSDHRATSLGRILRSCSIDELPRWWNVLRGDMSIVGPRPSDPERDVPEPDADRSDEVPPGLTGTWSTRRRAS
jgi:lipopolysaccharide/colanic/teichoic acid biosynthesis glycosyltransferase